MLRKIHTLVLVICLLFALGISASFAEDETGIRVFSTNICTSDINATYIEGEVPVAEGQEILVKEGFKIIASRIMPDTNAKASFSIKIPAKYINKDRVTVLYIRARAGNNTPGSGNVRVEVSYKERETQKINVNRKSFSVTMPGEDKTLIAKATSGNNLMYVSNDPGVAEIDKSGKIVPKGAGETTVSVKQIGDGRYKGAEETVKVSVEAIDAYTVTFHSSDNANDINKQIISTNTDTSLQENIFSNGDHKFLGWATEDGGLVKYDDRESVIDLAEKGENTDLYAVWTGDGAVAAVKWAIDIANDDSFTYGAKPAANAIGCYFCGTNCGPVKHNKPKGYEKTYVCLTFVAAAYAHGAEDPEVYYACSNGKMPLYENDNNFTKFSCWTKIGQCSNLSINDLEPGDVVIQWSDHNDNSGHTWMYAGDDKLVESSGGGWGANSIALKEGASKRLSSYGRNSKNYVMRYTGVNAQN